MCAQTLTLLSSCCAAVSAVSARCSTKVSCCDRAGYGRDSSFVPVDTSIGKCSWRYDPYLLALINYLITLFLPGAEPLAGPVKVGTFSVQW